MRYKVGDKVVIRKDLKGGRDYGKGSDAVWFATSMEQYCGKTVIVRETRDYGLHGAYHCSTEDCSFDMWNYNDTMIDHKATRELTESPKFKVGDKVKVVKESDHFAPKECTGRVGEIKMIGYSNPEIKVYFGEEIDGSYTWYFSEDELEVVVEDSPKFTKSDLKDRYIVTFGDGEYGMVDGDKIRIIQDGEFLNHMTYDVADLRENLTDVDDAEFYDIVAVHKPEYKTIWERTETIKEMTISDIEKALGHKIKVVK